MFRRLWRFLRETITGRAAVKQARDLRRRLLPPDVNAPRPEPPAPEELEGLPPPAPRAEEAPELQPARPPRWPNLRRFARNWSYRFRRLYRAFTHKRPADAPVRTQTTPQELPVFAATPPKPPRRGLRRFLRAALRRAAQRAERAAKAAWRVANRPLWPRSAAPTPEAAPEPPAGAERPAAAPTAPVAPPKRISPPGTAGPPRRGGGPAGGPFGLPFGRHLSNIQKAFIERLTKLMLGITLASRVMGRIAGSYQRFAPTAAVIERRRELHDIRRALRIDQAIGPHLNRISQNIEKILDVLVDTLIPLLEAIAPLVEAATWVIARIAEATQLLAVGIHVLRGIMKFLQAVFGGSKDEPAPMSKVLRDYMAFVAPAPPPGPIIP